MLQASDLIQLPKGQAFALIEGGQLVKLRLPLIDDHVDELLLPGLAEVVADMRQGYDRYVVAAESNAAVDASNVWPLDSDSDSITVQGRGSGF